MRLGPSELSAFRRDALIFPAPDGTAPGSAAPAAHDPVPFALPSTEFRTLTVGLRQRASLLGAVLSDIYGEQRTMQSGALPSPLVRANPRVLASGSFGSTPVLETYAADLLRGPDGAWWVVADHTGEGVRSDLLRATEGRVANSPGCAALEAPAFAAVLPSLCRVLLGETLRLPSVPTVWFGDTGAIRKVAESYRRWAVRPAFDPHPAPVPLAELSVTERIALHEAATAEPWSLVACLAQPSAAGALLLRVVLFRDGTDWQVHPHCVARALPEGVQPGGALPPHCPYKDVWIVG